MDYEKRYKEVLERAKQKYAIFNGMNQGDVIEDIFPELKESEDVRIRKFLHHTFTAQYLAKDKLSKWHGEPVTNILAWLEKQGEQKSADKIVPKFHEGDIVKYKKNPHLTYILKRFTDVGGYEFHAIGKDGNEGETCFATVEYQDEWELVEQKTAWSEKDEIGLYDAMWAIEQARTIAKDENDMGNLWYAEKWLKSLKDRIHLEAEW